MQFENDETLTDEIIYNNVEAVQHAWLINKKRYSFFYPFEVNVLIINKICFSYLGKRSFKYIFARLRMSQVLQLVGSEA